MESNHLSPAAPPPPVSGLVLLWRNPKNHFEDIFPTNLHLSLLNGVPTRVINDKMTSLLRCECEGSPPDPQVAVWPETRAEFKTEGNY